MMTNDDNDNHDNDDDDDDDTCLWSTQAIVTERTKSKYRNINLSHGHFTYHKICVLCAGNEIILPEKVFGCLSLLWHS
jgi:hypothetical protein